MIYPRAASSSANFKSSYLTLTRVLSSPKLPTRSMASIVDSIPHTVRTANDPRQTGLYDVTLSKIEQVNYRTRVLRLSLARDGPPFHHLPGQWLDVHIPDIPQAGGFTITSPPSTAIVQNSSPAPSESQGAPYVELAIQYSPANPPAAYFWLPPAHILNKPLRIRVGGAFTYPPPALSFEECQRIERAVFIAGGVGVNPLMSMLSSMQGRGPGRVGGMARYVRVLYSVRKSEGEGEVCLFYERINDIAESYKGSKDVDFKFVLYDTSGRDRKNGMSGVDAWVEKSTGTSVEHKSRRIEHGDLLECLGPEEGRKNTVVFVCGPSKMTDEFVEVMRKAPSMEEDRVLCEKWW